MSMSKHLCRVLDTKNGLTGVKFVKSRDLLLDFCQLFLGVNPDVRYHSELEHYFKKGST